MPKTDWSARSSSERRRPWLVPPDPETNAADRTTVSKPAGTPAGGGTVRGRSEPNRKHFVEPYPYTQAQRKAITQALAGARLGDAMAREIFIGAIAYDLALLAAAQAELDASETAAATASGGVAAAEKPAAEVASTGADETRTGADAAAEVAALAQIAAQARALADNLAALEPAARGQLMDRLTDTDPLARTYGAAALDALAAELAHLGVACTPAPMPDAQAEAPPVPEPPTASPRRRDGVTDETATRDFIQRAAQVYEQCFDARPAPAADAPFATVLKAVAEATGLRLAVDDATLERALTTG